MGPSDEDKSVIIILYYIKNYGTAKLIHKFPAKKRKTF